MKNMRDIGYPSPFFILRSQFSVDSLVNPRNLNLMLMGWHSRNPPMRDKNGAADLSTIAHIDQGGVFPGFVPGGANFSCVRVQKRLTQRRKDAERMKRDYSVSRTKISPKRGLILPILSALPRLCVRPSVFYQQENRVTPFVPCPRRANPPGFRTRLLLPKHQNLHRFRKHPEFSRVSAHCEEPVPQDHRERRWRGVHRHCQRHEDGVDSSFPRHPSSKARVLNHVGPFREIRLRRGTPCRP